LTRQRFDRHRGYALLGNDVERGFFPVLGGEARSREFVDGSLQHSGMVTTDGGKGEVPKAWLLTLRCSKIGANSISWTIRARIDSSKIPKHTHPYGSHRNSRVDLQPPCGDFRSAERR